MSNLLRAKEVAGTLNVSPSQVFAMMKSGQIPTVRFGRCVRIRPEDLEEFIQTNLTNHTTTPLKAKLPAATERMESKKVNPSRNEATYESQ